MQDSKFKTTKANEESDAEDFTGDRYCTYSRRVMQVVTLSVHIDEEFKRPQYYRNIIEEMEHLTELDNVQFRINSPGGYVAGLVGLLEAIRVTDASVLAVITGDCHSAGSMLALSCDKVIVSPYATMMIHSIGYGINGKGPDVANMVKHSTEYNEKLVRAVYAGFLTEKEIEAVLNGQEFWFQSEEIELRLAQREIYRSKLAKAEERAKKLTSK